jgi:O-antigen ligase
MVTKHIWKGERLLPRSSLDVPIGVLFVLALGSVFASIHKSSSIWALLRLLLYVVSFYVTLDLARSREQTKRLALTILGVGTALAFLGFVKYQGGTYPLLWDYPYGEGQRLNSSFLNANHVAGYLAMVLSLGIGLFLYRPFSRTLIWSIPLLLILVALCLTLSRGGWVGSFIALSLMLVLFLLKKKVSRLKVCAIAVALLFTVTLTILASNPMIERLQSMQNIKEPSLVSRSVVWKGSTKLILENPLLGTGLGTFPWSFTSVRPPGLTLRWREAHNDYVQIVSEMGLPVLIPLIWGIFLVMRLGLQRFRETESRFHSGITLGALGGISTMLIHSVFDFNIQIAANGILFSVLIALAVGTKGEKARVHG